MIDIISEAKALVESASNEKIPVRMLGAAAIMVHCQSSLLGRFQRQLSDIDLAAYGKDRNKIEKLLLKEGYAPNVRFNMIHGNRRLIFLKGPEQLKADFFMDKLDFCHPIEFRKRLESDYPTLPVTELLLEKLQIVKITQKDTLDTMALIHDHDISDSDKDSVNAEYLSRLLSEDWGFYYTATTNLKLINTKANEQTVLSSQEKGQISERIGRLLKLIEEKPKSLAWKMRSRVGTKVKWYYEVDDVER